MPSELRLIANYAVSSLMCYIITSAVNYYLLDSISEGPSQIIKLICKLIFSRITQLFLILSCLLV